MNYIYEFAAVAIVVGITGFFQDKLRGTLGKAASIVPSLVLMLCILMPVVSSIKGGGLSGNFPEMEITEEYKDDAEYLERLKELTEEKLALMELEYIKRQFGYGEKDISLKFTGEIEEGAYKLSQAELTIKTMKALSRREEMRGYISGKYLCDVIVLEEIH